MIDATYPAPNPLSMFTTETFDAQEFSIPSSAAQSLERRAIADAGGHGDHRHADQAADHAGQARLPFPRKPHHASAGQHVALRQQAMDAGNAHVVHVLHLVAHDLRRDHSFFGNRNIAGTRRHHDDLSLAVDRLVLRQGDGARQFVKLRLAELALHRAELLRRNARRQHVVAVLREPAENRGEVRGSLSRSKDHLRHADAQRAMMVHVGESQVFERQMLQLLHRLVGRELALSSPARKAS